MDDMDTTASGTCTVPGEDSMRFPVAYYVAGGVGIIATGLGITLSALGLLLDYSQGFVISGCVFLVIGASIMTASLIYFRKLEESACPNTSIGRRSKSAVSPPPAAPPPMSSPRRIDPPVSREFLGDIATSFDGGDRQQVQIVSSMEDADLDPKLLLPFVDIELQDAPQK